MKEMNSAAEKFPATLPRDTCKTAGEKKQLFTTKEITLCSLLSCQIALKFHENTFFKLDSILHSCGDDTFTKQQIVRAEQQILQTIRYELCGISIYDFVSLYISVIFSLNYSISDQRIHQVQKWLENEKNEKECGKYLFNCGKNGSCEDGTQDFEESLGGLTDSFKTFSFVPKDLLNVCETLVDISVFSREFLGFQDVEICSLSAAIVAAGSAILTRTPKNNISLLKKLVQFTEIDIGVIKATANKLIGVFFSSFPNSKDCEMEQIFYK